MCLPGRLPIVARRASSIAMRFLDGLRSRPVEACDCCLSLRSLLSACGSGGFSLKQAEVDRTILHQRYSGSSADVRRRRTPLRRSDDPQRGVVGRHREPWRCRPCPGRTPRPARAARSPSSSNTGTRACSAAASATTRESFDGVAPVQGRGLHGQRPAPGGCRHFEAL